MLHLIVRVSVCWSKFKSCLLSNLILLVGTEQETPTQYTMNVENVAWLLGLWQMAGGGAKQISRTKTNFRFCLVAGNSGTGSGTHI